MPKKKVQIKIKDFFQTREKLEPRVIEPGPIQPEPPRMKGEQGAKGTSQKERGFNFCNRNGCRYCPNLNKTGKITCFATNQSFDCMRNISCRSSNVVYAVSCKKCGKQYVGQTMLRIKDRFKNHFYDVVKKDRTKALGLHFSQQDHNGIQDIEITVLEFIKKPPRSPEASIIRDRVEKRWIHLLRCPAPQELNIFD